MNSETLPPEVRVHIVGAGPVGLMLAALFQPMERFSVHLYEKRRAYTRTRMVQLRDYLVADSVASYCTDYIDGESVEALFDAEELAEGLAFCVPTTWQGETVTRFCIVNPLTTADDVRVVLDSMARFD